MAAGKARTRGPISKALAGKLSMRTAIEDVKRDYRNGVANAADAWVAGELNYLSRYVSEIKQFVNDPNFKKKQPIERMKEALKKTSEIAKKYDEDRASDLNDQIMNAYQSAQSSSGGQPMKTSSKNTGNTIVV